MHRLLGRVGPGAWAAVALLSGCVGSPLSMAAAPMALPLGAAKANRAVAAQEDAYILGAGDSLDLKLFDAPELSGGLDVLNDGTVSLPLIGSVRVQGLTLSQAQQWFTTLFRKQLQRPDLQLKVVRPRPIRVALVGEVERPGIYTLTTSESAQTEGGPSIAISGLPTLVDALQKAGGITLNANLRDVTLQRRLPGEAPSYKRASLNLLDLVFEGDQQQNPLLFDGDTIRVGRADQPVPESVALASTTLTAKRITVYVVGEVERPGATEVSANIPLVQAVLAAGGPKLNRASRSNVELVRINRNGTALRETFKLDFGQGASNAKNPPLRDGDAVIVNRNGLAVASDALNAVGQPLTSVVNIWALTRLVQ
jgi:polysaccharide export outer membrane protein